MKKMIICFVSFSILAVAYSNCSQTGFQSSAASLTSTASNFSNGGTGTVRGGGTGTGGVNGGNVITLTAGCGNDLNVICASVTICAPGTNNCQTISNLLVDTGSPGLRIFSSAISINLPTEVDSSGRTYGTCAIYAGGNYQWGPVRTADIILGQEKASAVPIEVIDNSFGDGGAACAAQDAGGYADSNADGYNGILGVQFLQQDCGSYCVTNANNMDYYGCSGSTCTNETIPLNKQIMNPVAALPSDNNGVIIQLPNVPATGATTVTGTLIMGIGTQSNNVPSGGVTTFTADANGNMITIFNGTTMEAYLDTGSSGLYFPDSSITQCNDGSGMYCPASTLNLTAVMESANQSRQETVAFSVADMNTLYEPNMVFNNIAGTAAAGTFAWGLPFHFGRTVYVGFENTSSTLGSGPFWAF